MESSKRRSTGAKDCGEYRQAGGAITEGLICLTSRLIEEVQQILFWGRLRRRLCSIWCCSLNSRVCHGHRCWRQKPNEQKADAKVTENAHGVSLPHPLKLAHSPTVSKDRAMHARRFPPRWTVEELGTPALS